MAYIPVCLGHPRIAIALARLCLLVSVGCSLVLSTRDHVHVICTSEKGTSCPQVSYLVKENERRVLIGGTSAARYLFTFLSERLHTVSPELDSR